MFKGDVAEYGVTSTGKMEPSILLKLKFIALVRKGVQ
jgi:hypothetical protein